MTNLREAAQMALDALMRLEQDTVHPAKVFPYRPAIIALRAALAQPEPEPVGNTLTFMTRAIFNIVADHQEINGGYFIADGDVAAFVDRLAKIINSTFEPLKHKNTTPPQREWQGLTDEEIENCFEMSMFGTCRAIEAKLKEKNA